MLVSSGTVVTCPGKTGPFETTLFFQLQSLQYLEKAVLAITDINFDVQNIFVGKFLNFFKKYSFH